MGAGQETRTMTKRRGGRTLTQRYLREVRRGDLEPARARLGLTQLEIAERLDVHVRTWAKWIAGERTCPWPVWLTIQNMKPGEKWEGKGPGQPSAEWYAEADKTDPKARKSRAVKKGA